MLVDDQDVGEKVNCSRVVSECALESSCNGLQDSNGCMCNACARHRRMQMSLM